MPHITIGFIDLHRQEKAISRAVDQSTVAYVADTLVSFRLGHEKFVMPRKLFSEMLRQLQMAEVIGAEYPDDLRGLAEAGYGIATDEETK